MPEEGLTDKELKAEEEDEYETEEKTRETEPEDDMRDLSEDMMSDEDLEDLERALDEGELEGEIPLPGGGWFGFKTKGKMTAYVILAAIVIVLATKALEMW